MCTGKLRAWRWLRQCVAEELCVAVGSLRVHGVGGFGVCQGRAVQLPGTSGFLCSDRKHAGHGTKRVESVVY